MKEMRLFVLVRRPPMEPFLGSKFRRFSPTIDTDIQVK